MCIEKMKKALRDGSSNISEYEEQLEKALVGNFESNCRKKEFLYFLREKRNNELNANNNNYTDYDSVDDEYFKNPRYNFERDVLGGDSSAIWNID